ncbi:hypothetical protein BGZ61DRAFT_492214 [Ilyonectria robusta]|uniref:uncharacterized protein n=1 Tax=Ilyonectria robusta TaxID=1079257 RepID=UPI001E8DD5D2|nr:uncharacterized protein BGZ61DRAFT_492214 [Ilyonectria robusta]KAH8721716.1 hypothetical protein BGZ61DRAFT_492214 [Ilyonectria robusta]
MKIEGRTFIISGGVSGLGKACAVDIVRRGGNVALLDLNEALGAAALEELGSSARFFRVDVTLTASIADAVEKTAQWAKEADKPIGGVIPGAGISVPTPIIDENNNPFSMDHVDKVLNINLRGTIDLIRQTLPHLTIAAPEGTDGERGVIIMIASLAAFEGQPGLLTYAATKGAVVSMTLPLARELSKFGIRVVSIAPGLFDTGMTKAIGDYGMWGKFEKAMEFPARPGRPEEFAKFASQAIENVMLNGEVIRLDGATRLPSEF